MTILISDYNPSYHLLDSGDGQKLEQFGPNRIIRPDGTCVWGRKLPEKEWEKADAVYTSEGWKIKKSFKEPWTMTYPLPGAQDTGISKLNFNLRLSNSKNIGIFPEHASHWSWMIEIIKKNIASPNVLNLFGHTGAATLCAAAAGATVCHVDSSRPAVNLAHANQELNNLEATSIRWIVDDCSAFVSREIKRGNKYDALIIDPPAFGHDQKGKAFSFEKKIYSLLELCTRVLIDKPLFIIFTGYAMGYSATVLYNLLSEFYPDANIDFGELQIKHHKRLFNLPCSIYARFSQK